MFLASSVFSQTLEECRKLAREHYPEIRQYDLIRQTEQYNLSNAAKVWIPQISLSAQASYQSAAPTYPEAFSSMMQAGGVNISGIRKDQYKVALDVSQHIWDGGKSAADKVIAQADANEQDCRVEVSLHDLQTRVDNVFFGILLFDERVSQTKSLIAMLESNLSRMQAYLKNGVATQSDVDVVEVELLTASQSLGQIEASRDCYRRVMEVFIGQPLSSDSLMRPEMQEVVGYESARPELALFDAQNNVLDARRKLINSATKPRFSAFAQGYYGYPGFDMFESMTSAKWSFNAIVGVRMSWNFGAYYTNNNNLEKLNIAQSQVSVRREVFLFNTEMKVAQEDGEIVRLRKAVDDDVRIVELRRRVRVAAESQFANGVIDATDLLRKITEESEAMFNLSAHEIALLQAIYRLKSTLNQ